MKTFLIAAALLCLAGTAQAANLAGTWQGEDSVRHVVKIHAIKGGWLGDLYNLGEEAASSPRNGNTISAVTVQDSAVTFSLDNTPGDFTGTLAADGNSMAGTWTTIFGPKKLTLTRVAPRDAWPIDPSPHKVRFVEAQAGVKLEVLDWGGNGPPLLLLAGLGNTAHVYDTLAPKLTDKHHVYGVTRRGFGLSSSPPITNENYDADRLGDDVLAVIDALKLERPVVAGHSIAGEELSSIGTRHPEKVAGLIYLDAIYQNSFYDSSQADLSLETATVRRDLDRMFDLSNDPARQRVLIADIQSTLPNLQKVLQETADLEAGAPDTPPPAQKPEDLAGNRIYENTRRYGPSNAPVLAILSEPRPCGRNCSALRQKIMAADMARSALFEKNSPKARVVRLALADHYLWRSNEADVLHEMNAFMDGLR